MSNLLDRAKQILHGAEVITEWLGSGGQVAEYQEAQSRAIICGKCDDNIKGFQVTTAVALAIKRHLAVKKKLNLKVAGEKSLGSCKSCGCVLRLLVWQPLDRVKAQLTDEEAKVLPKNCWKIKS